jgi:hypothetical protein
MKSQENHKTPLESDVFSNKEVLAKILDQCVADQIDVSKFAELIIRECISLCDDHSERKILEHFGMEETRQCF